MKNTIVLFCVLLAISFAACDNDVPCADLTDENTGDIIQSLEVGCFFDLPNGQLTITSDSVYTALADSLKNIDPDCSFPNVDFDQNSVIGFTTNGSGCTRSYLRSFSESGNNEYLYKVTVRECGGCEPLEISNNLVVVPKLKEGWTVNFEADRTVDN
ncbi:MAG: hypothetical protein AAFO94_10565 [Bacteroidota bacterium]